MAPVFAAFLGLLAMLVLVIGVVAWSMPAGPWLVGAGAAIFLACATVIWRAVSRQGDAR